MDDVVLARWREFVAEELALCKVEIDHFELAIAKLRDDEQSVPSKGNARGKLRHKQGLFLDHLIVQKERFAFLEKLLLNAHADLDRRGYPKSEWTDLAIERINRAS